MIDLLDLDNTLRLFNPQKAVEYFRHLIWCEADRVRIPKHLIHIPTSINIPDGGIDAEIHDANPISLDLIPNGLSGYQIKLRDHGSKKSIEELHINQRITNPLKPSIKDLIARRGTYILVTFKTLVAPKKQEREKMIRDHFASNGFPNIQVRVYDASQIIGFSRPFPSLAIYLNTALKGAQHYESWGKNFDTKTPVEYFPDKIRSHYIWKIRHLLRTSSNSVCVRINGRSGVGKTRFVYEIFKPQDLKPRVLYQESINFVNSDLCRFLENNPLANVIVVLDNCPLEIHDQLVNRIVPQGQKINLITIGPPEKEHDFTNTKVFKLTELQKFEIEMIVFSSNSTIQRARQEKIARFSNGYPKIAVRLANRFDNLLEISDEIIFDRLIGGDIDLTSEKFRQMKRICMYLSLFPFIGHSQINREYLIRSSLQTHIPYRLFYNRLKDFFGESKWLAQNLGIEGIMYLECISDLQKLEVIQGDFMISITPYPLVSHLIYKWWEIYGGDAGVFFTSLPLPLKTRFWIQMIILNIETNDILYTRVVNFLEYLLENNRKDGEELVSFIVFKLNEFHPNDRERFLLRIVEDNLLIQTLGRYLIIFEPSNLSGEEKERLLEIVLQNRQTREKIASILSRIYILHPKRNFNKKILEYLLMYQNEPQIAFSLLRLIGKQYPTLPNDIQERFFDIILNQDITIGLLNAIEEPFRNLPENAQARIIAIFLARKTYSSVLTLFFFHHNNPLFTREIKEGFLRSLAQDESNARYLLYFFAQNNLNLDSAFLQEIFRTMSQYQTVEGKICRYFLAVSPVLPEQLRSMINLTEKEKTDNFNEARRKFSDEWTISFINLLKNYDEMASALHHELQDTYRPKKIKILFISGFISQSTKDTDADFYNPEAENPDLFFDSLMAVIFPNLKLETVENKINVLQMFFQRDYYVEDGFPISYPLPLDNSIELYINLWFKNVLLLKLASIIDKTTPIIIIGDPFYQILSPQLIELGYTIANVGPIPFPPMIKDAQFVRALKSSLQNANDLLSKILRDL